MSGASGTLTVDSTAGTQGSFTATALTLSVPGITASGSVSGSIALPASGFGGHFRMAISGSADARC